MTTPPVIIHDLIVNDNIGIGTMTPTEKLDVVGNALVSGNVNVEQNIITRGDIYLTKNTNPLSSVDLDGLRLGDLFTLSQKGQDIDGEAAGDFSGHSVSLSADGSIVAIGAIANQGVNGTNSGHVRVYEWSGSAWVQKGQDIDGESADDRSGLSVSLSTDGLTLAIGAPLNDGNGTTSGHVRVYEWSGSDWSQKGDDIDGEAADDQSGLSVSLSGNGNILAIGAPNNDGVNGNLSGHVRVYDWSGSAWSQKGQDIDGEAASDLSGRSVSLSADGSIVAIGAPLNDGNGSNSGHVRVWEWSGSAWVQKGQDIDGEVTLDQSGRTSISLSANGLILAIGAGFNDGNGTDSGHVRVWEWSGSTWVQKGQDIDGETAGDNLGYSVSLSNDGLRLAVSAQVSDYDSFTNNGQVYVYEWNSDTSTWTRIGQRIYGTALNDQFGFSINLSGNGTVLACGAPYRDSNTGYVRVYDIQPDHSLQHFVNGNPVLSLLPFGNVGIGTTNPAEKLVVVGNALVSGNVGIGTTNPTEKLDVVGNVKVDGNFNLNNIIINTDNTCHFGNIDNINKLNVVTFMNTSQFLRFRTGGNPISYAGVEFSNFDNETFNMYVRFDTLRFTYNTTPPTDQASNLDGKEVMVIKGNGNVGIGTTNPTQLLHVNGTVLTGDNIFLNGITGVGENGLRLHNVVSTGTSYIDNRGTGSLIFRLDNGTANTERMRITSAGNVGIGTTTPTQRLHVIGNAYINSKIGIGSTYIETSILNILHSNGGFNFNETQSNAIRITSGTSDRSLYMGYDNTNNTGYIQSAQSGSYTTLSLNRRGGDIRTLNGVISSSDDRIKHQEQFITNATPTLLKLRPQLYLKSNSLDDTIDGEYIVTANEDGTTITRKMIKESGLIAQEIYYDTPELRHIVSLPNGIDESNISEPPANYYESRDDPTIDPDWSAWGDSTAGVNYNGLIAYLIQGFKEQYTELQQEKDKVSQLETIISQQQSQLEQQHTLLQDLLARLTVLEQSL